MIFNILKIFSIATIYSIILHITLFYLFSNEQRKLRKNIIIHSIQIIHIFNTPFNYPFLLINIKKKITYNKCNAQ